MTDKVESRIKSADDLIVQSEAEKLGKAIPKIEPKETPKDEASAIEAPKETEQKAVEEPPKDDEPIEEETPQKEEEVKEEKEEASSETSDEEVDEYGIKVGKPKLYTEDQVQRMIRQRLANRGNSEKADVQEAAKDFQHDPDSEESWEQQLETFIDRTIEKRETKLREREWKEYEHQEQAKFETKFTQGMSKYQDFQDIVSNKPITNAMMLATRSMNDPAAFIYAACKQQPKELERIAQIKDPVAQAAEIGRLEERMKKTRKITSSPKPIAKISSDVSDELPQLDIDSRIAQHAKSKIMRR